MDTHISFVVTYSNYNRVISDSNNLNLIKNKIY